MKLWAVVRQWLGGSIVVKRRYVIAATPVQVVVACAQILSCYGMAWHGNM